MLAIDKLPVVLDPAAAAVAVDIMGASGRNDTLLDPSPGKRLLDAAVELLVAVVVVVPAARDPIRL